METRELADKIILRLADAGYTAYFAGGWVRDFVLGQPSADIDIATNAPPEKIEELFPKTISVGISFGVVVVVMEGHQFEVSTFRRDLGYDDGRRPTEIALSTPEEDALRRDFTINGMFYDSLNGKVIDYIHGREDLKQGIIRTIGDPRERFAEDRLRMIRAVRFAVRFGFPIDPDTRHAIQEQASTLFPAVSMERIWQELKKMAERPNFDRAILEMHRLGLLGVVFPRLKSIETDELSRYIASYRFFPKECPPILYLMELFPEASLSELVELCRYLKVSNRDIKLVELTASARPEKRVGWEAVDWARYYAKPQATLCLEVVAARLPDEERREFLKAHIERKRDLEKHIRRDTPLVAAADLQQVGIAPGKKMGELLREAERIAVNEDLEEKENVIEKLKKGPKWPQ